MVEKKSPADFKRERPDIISYGPLGRGSEKSIQKFIHRGSSSPSSSRRNTVTVEITVKNAIRFYSKQAGRGSKVNIIFGRSLMVVVTGL